MDLLLKKKAATPVRAPVRCATCAQSLTHPKYAALAEKETKLRTKRRFGTGKKKKRDTDPLGIDKHTKLVTPAMAPDAPTILKSP